MVVFVNVNVFCLNELKCSRRVLLIICLYAITLYALKYVFRDSSVVFFYVSQATGTFDHADDIFCVSSNNTPDI